MDGIIEGDCLTFAEGSATSNVLIRETMDAVSHLRDLKVWFGVLIAGHGLSGRGSKAGTYAGFLGARELVERGEASIHPLPYSMLGRFLSGGAWKVSVLVASGCRTGERIRVGPHLGPIASCIAGARLTIVQPTTELPEVAGTLIDADCRVIELPESANRLPELEDVQPSAIEAAMASHVAMLVPDGATIELGIGRTIDAVARGLASKSRLGVHTGLMSDASQFLMSCGAVTNCHKAFEPGRSVATGLLGSRALYRFAHQNDQLLLCPAEMTHSAMILQNEPCFVAINSALEVDLVGQVNCEAVDGRYIGAVGGVPDFHNAAYVHRNGRAIIALASQAPSGRSRIVARLSGPATLPASVADLVVTEFGVASLRDRSLEERRNALIAIAHPDHRRRLAG
jgi:acetyl-CoA hydrolase